MQIWLKQKTRPNFNCCGPGCSVMEQTVSREPDSSSSTREIPCLLWHLKLHKRVYNNPQSSELCVTHSNVLRLIPDKPASLATHYFVAVLTVNSIHSQLPSEPAAASFHILRTSGIAVTTVNIHHYRGDNWNFILQPINSKYNILLLVLQYVDWLAALNLHLLQAILFIAVWLSAPMFLATCFEVLQSRHSHILFDQILLLQGCLLQTRYA